MNTQTDYYELNTKDPTAEVMAQRKQNFRNNQRGSISPRTLVIAGLAVVFGVSAVIAVREFMKNESGSSNNTSVLMTAQDIPRGIMITAELLTTKDYRKEEVPEGALTTITQAIDRAVEIPMIKGEPVLEGKLALKGAGRGLAALVPKGMRAVTIQTTNVATGVAGLIMPGNQVDVMMTMNDQGGGSDTTGGGSTITLLQRIEVLAVDQRVNEPTNNKVDPKEMRSVTLLVTPQQANMLDLGQNRGILHLALRNPGDTVDTRAQAVTLNDLRFRQSKPWDERIKGIIETYARAHPPSTAAESPAAQKPPEPPPLLKIRTIRGANEGSMYVESIAPPNPGRP